MKKCRCVAVLVRHSTGRFAVTAAPTAAPARTPVLAPAPRHHRSILQPLFLVPCALVLLFSAAAQARPRRLPVKGFNDAALVPPSGKGTLPVVVGLHGNFDRPEWLCGAMSEVVSGRAWLLCPRGRLRRDTPREYDRWTYPSRRRLRAEIKAALAALEAKHPGRQAARPVVLAGFSLGAIYAARFAVAAPGTFPWLYLVEGSHKVWTPANIRRFARGGGKAVLFGCGQKWCGRATRRICKGLRSRGVRCAEITVPGLGHSYGRPLTIRARPWFAEMMLGIKRTSPPPGKK